MIAFGSISKIFWKAIQYVCGTLTAAMLIVAVCGSVWTWLFTWLIVGWILRREIGQKAGPAIVWIINLLIVLLGGWILVRRYGQWLWSREETFNLAGRTIIHEYNCPLAIAANEQEAIWAREKERSKRKPIDTQESV